MSFINKLMSLFKGGGGIDALLNNDMVKNAIRPVLDKILVNDTVKGLLKQHVGKFVKNEQICTLIQNLLADEKVVADAVAEVAKDTKVQENLVKEAINTKTLKESAAELVPTIATDGEESAINKIKEKIESEEFQSEMLNKITDNKAVHQAFHKAVATVTNNEELKSKLKMK